MLTIFDLFFAARNTKKKLVSDNVRITANDHVRNIKSNFSSISECRRILQIDRSSSLTKYLLSGQNYKELQTDLNCRPILFILTEKRVKCIDILKLQLGQYAAKLIFYDEQILAAIADNIVANICGKTAEGYLKVQRLES